MVHILNNLRSCSIGKVAGDKKKTLVVTISTKLKPGPKMCHGLKGGEVTCKFIKKNCDFFQ